jgi:hypothetical protein
MAAENGQRSDLEAQTLGSVFPIGNEEAISQQPSKLIEF